MGGQRFGVLDSCFLHLYLSSVFSSNGDLKMIEPLKAIYDVGQLGPTLWGSECHLYDCFVRCQNVVTCAWDSEPHRGPFR